MFPPLLWPEKGCWSGGMEMWRCSAVQCSAVQCSAVQCSAVICGLVSRSSGWSQCDPGYWWRRRRGDLVQRFATPWTYVSKPSFRLWLPGGQWHYCHPAPKNFFPQGPCASTLVCMGARDTKLFTLNHPYQMSDILQKYWNGHLSSVLTYSSDGEDLYPAIRVWLQ